MSETLTKYGILVGVDGSPESSAAVSWAAREASMRHEHVTLMHVEQPVAVSWPVNPEQTAVAEWQDENARHVIDQARCARQSSAGLIVGSGHVHRHGDESPDGAGLQPLSHLGIQMIGCFLRDQTSRNKTDRLSSRRMTALERR